VGPTSDPIAHLALVLVVLLVAARLGGELAVRVGIPQVLGELLAGVALRAVPGTAFVQELAADPAVDILARLGALLLLFDAGLALAVRDVLRVGAAATRVALIGTIASLALGFGVATWLLPAAPASTRAFLAGALSATSVGVGARVLKDLGKSRTIEARTILGASVIDDVLGLIVLSLVVGWASRGASGASGMALVGLLARTAGFFGLALAFGPWLMARLFHGVARLRTRGALIVAGLTCCFALAWVADAIGLAPIVGAFTAGLVLEEVHWRDFTARGERGLSEEVEPLGAMLVPLFFVVLGARTDVRTFAEPRVLVLALALTAAAVLGKLACGLGASRGTNRLAVAFGMMPRGEVTLVFAGLGLTLGPPGATVLDRDAYAALVAMVVATTLLTPLGLSRSFARSGASATDAPR
jgi:Kef-type K+ transport system membrane component KefB